MAIVEGQKVEIKWGSRNKDWYENRGYKYNGYGEPFLVDVKDLTDGTIVKVLFICDYCNGVNQFTEKQKRKSYKDLIRYRKLLNKDACGHKDCALKKKKENISIAKPPKEKSLSEKFP